MHALDQVGFDVLHAGRQIDRDQAGPGAGRDEPSRGSGRAIASAATPRGALEQARRGDRQRQVVQRRQLTSNRFRSEALAGCRCRSRPRATRRRSAPPASADADPDRLLRGRVTIVARASAGRGQLGVRAHCTQCTRDRRRPDDAGAIEHLRPARTPAASSAGFSAAGVEDVAPRGRVRCAGTRARRAIRRRGCCRPAPGRAAQRARAGAARRARPSRARAARHAGGDARRSVRLDVLRRSGVDQRPDRPGVEADDLAEDDAVQAAARQRLLAGSGVGDVADGAAVRASSASMIAWRIGARSSPPGRSAAPSGVDTHAGSDGAGDTLPHSHDSSRCVCALIRPAAGRSARGRASRRLAVAAKPGRSRAATTRSAGRQVTPPVSRGKAVRRSGALHQGAQSGRSSDTASTALPYRGQWVMVPSPRCWARCRRAAGVRAS